MASHPAPSGQAQQAPSKEPARRASEYVVVVTWLKHITEALAAVGAHGYDSGHCLAESTGLRYRVHAGAAAVVVEFFDDLNMDIVLAVLRSMYGHRGCTLMAAANHPGPGGAVIITPQPTQPKP